MTEVVEEYEEYEEYEEETVGEVSGSVLPFLCGALTMNAC